MAYILPTVAADSIVTIPVGTSTGTIGPVSHTGCTYRGTDRDTCIIRIDDALSVHNGVVYGAAIATVTFEDCTIDGDGVATLVSLISAAYYSAARVVLRRVRIIGNHKNTIGFIATALDGETAVTWLLDDVTFEGDGRSIVVTGTSGVISNVTIYGGAGGLTVASNGGACTIVAEDFNGLHAYWQGPTGETVTLTAVDSLGVDVVSNDTANRALYDTVRLLQTIGTGTVTDGEVSIAVEEFDRVETAAGVWAEADEDGAVSRWHLSNSWIHTNTPADGTAVTVLRPVIGRLFGWTSTTLDLVTGLGFPSGSTWRRPNGDALVPSLGSIARAEIMRVASAVRDVDTGGIHLTAPCVDCQIVGGVWCGWWSDQVTDRGDDTALVNLEIYRGQDMNITGTGTNTRIIGCDLHDAGVCNIYVGGVAGANASVAIIDCTNADPMRHGYTDQVYPDIAIDLHALFDTSNTTGAIGGAGNPDGDPRNAVLNPRAHITVERV